VHEYELTALATDGIVMNLMARPRVLPDAERPGATPNASWLVGVELCTVPSAVLERLHKTDCCIHLNDSLRARADAPRLVEALR